MKHLTIVILGWLAITLAACGGGQTYASYQIECPPDSAASQGCSTTPVSGVTPPPMTYSEIRYHLVARDLASDVLYALMVQYSTYASCWHCWDAYWADPSWSIYHSRYTSVYDLPPSQRVQVVQQSNVTVINNSKTVIQSAKASQPPAAQLKSAAASPPSITKSTSAASPAAAHSPSAGPSPAAAPAPRPAGGGVGGGSSLSSTSRSSSTSSTSTSSKSK